MNPKGEDRKYGHNYECKLRSEEDENMKVMFAVDDVMYGIVDFQRYMLEFVQLSLYCYIELIDLDCLSNVDHSNVENNESHAGNLPKTNQLCNENDCDIIPMRWNDKKHTKSLDVSFLSSVLRSSVHCFIHQRLVCCVVGLYVLCDMGVHDHNP